jgi:hydroxyethylthiazole kinase-like uncharacterized protein yjeF
MQRITPFTEWPLHGVSQTRAMEAQALGTHPHPSLMQRAGQSVAQLAMAWAPHAQRIWVACGPGNNGGDGLHAAIDLHALGKSVWLTLCPGDHPSADALDAVDQVKKAGIPIHAQAPKEWDLGIDALLGLGHARPPAGRLQQHLHLLRQAHTPLLCVDVPTGLMSDSGQWMDAPYSPQRSAPLATLSLLTLKPGLFTLQGKDASGEVWFDDLGHPAGASYPPDAHLVSPRRLSPKTHHSHKGSHGQVLVLGGAPGMTGAAVLAALSALHAGVGKVVLGLLNPSALAGVQTQYPSLMALAADASTRFEHTVVCGCGGGQAIRPYLPAVLSRSPQLVLDADALNAIAQDPGLQTLLGRRSAAGLPTVLTPHPLEAARLLHCTVAQVQSDRCAAAQRLAQRWSCVVVLKGAGTVMAAPNAVPAINPTGNPRLACAGTGDVLAGLVGAAMARGLAAWPAAHLAVFQHGLAADHWPEDQALTAEALARTVGL